MKAACNVCMCRCSLETDVLLVMCRMKQKSYRSNRASINTTRRLTEVEESLVTLSESRLSA